MSRLLSDNGSNVVRAFKEAAETIRETADDSSVLNNDENGLHVFSFFFFF